MTPTPTPTGGEWAQNGLGKALGMRILPFPNTGALAVFAKHPRIERYAWYPWTTNNELFLSGALTSLGTEFAGAAATK